MAEKYYFDTCIWRDFYESRKGTKGRPLGKYAADLIKKIIRSKDNLFYSYLTVKELRISYNEDDINDMLNLLFMSGLLKRAMIKKEDYLEASKIAKKRNLPTPDVLHALLARKSRAIFVSQDKHAQELKDVVEVKKPEEIC